MLWTVKQSIKISLRALLSNKGRSFLTMLGIIIGVSSVIIIMAVGAGAQSLIFAQIKSVGSDLVGVLPGKAEKDEPPAQAMGIVVTTLKYDDAIALRNKKNVPNLKYVCGYSMGMGTLSWNSNNYDSNIYGAMASYLDVEGGEVEEGRFFTDEEEKNLSKVVVLGHTVKKELFGDSPAIGQKIKVKKHSFEVIGIMKERGKVAMQDYDDMIIIPIITMQKIIQGVDHLGFIRGKLDNEENLDKVMEDMAIVLRDQHDIKDQSGDSDDFTIRSAAQAIDMIEKVTNALKYFLVAMAALSLIVGGIGIMNIMLVSVSERTREIGLRKAIGARNFDISMQFLFEASTITLLGGMIDIITGSVISLIIAIGAQLLGYDWSFVISPLSIIVALVVSISVGLIFGVYPAKKASELEPVEALHYE